MNFINSTEEISKLSRTIRKQKEIQWESIKYYRTKLNKNFGERYYKILKLRYRENKTLEEVGKEFGVPRERVRQIENKIFQFIKSSEN